MFQKIKFYLLECEALLRMTVYQL